MRKEKAITAIREVLAQPERPAVQGEPVAWMDIDGDLYKELPSPNWNPPHTPLYTTPQPAAPERKPLSMQERTSIVRANKSFHDKDEIDAYGIIDDVEAAHGIKEKNT